MLVAPELNENEYVALGWLEKLDVSSRVWAVDARERIVVG